MPTSRTHRIPDAHLEYWGRVFIAGGFIDRGIDFERFLRSPHVFVSSARAAVLAEAGAIEQALVDQVPGARLRDCHLVEPLHHHAHGHRVVRRTS